MLHQKANAADVRNRAAGPTRAEGPASRACLLSSRGGPQTFDCSRHGLDRSELSVSQATSEVSSFLCEVRDEGVQPQRVGWQLQERLHERRRLVGEINPVLDCEAGGLDDRPQPVGRRQVAEFGSVGPRQRIPQLATLTRCDVPNAKPPAAHQYPAGFLIEAALVGHVHLNVLAEDDSECGVDERQFGDVRLLDGNPIAQFHNVIEPTVDIAILCGQIDGGDAAGVRIGDEASGTADPAARVKYLVGRCDPDQLHQLAGGNATHGVEVLEKRKV